MGNSEWLVQSNQYSSQYTRLKLLFILAEFGASYADNLSQRQEGRKLETSVPILDDIMPPNESDGGFSKVSSSNSSLSEVILNQSTARN